MDYLKPPISARYADYVPQFAEQHTTSAQKAGLLYERKVMRRLSLLYPNNKLEVGPWLIYNSAKRSGICQPDALLWLTEDVCCIVEVKLTWVREAREKLIKFYGPIVQAIHPSAHLLHLQIYKNARKGSHKNTLSINDLLTQTKAYRECQVLL